MNKRLCELAVALLFMAAGAARAELGQFDDSVREMRLAETALDADSEAWRPSLEARRALYQGRQPYHEPAEPTRNAGAELLAGVY